MTTTSASGSGIATLDASVAQPRRRRATFSRANRTPAQAHAFIPLTPFGHKLHLTAAAHWEPLPLFFLILFFQLVLVLVNVYFTITPFLTDGEPRPGNKGVIEFAWVLSPLTALLALLNALSLLLHFYILTHRHLPAYEASALNALASLLWVVIAVLKWYLGVFGGVVAGVEVWGEKDMGMIPAAVGVALLTAGTYMVTGSWAATAHVLEWGLEELLDLERQREGESAKDLERRLAEGGHQDNPRQVGAESASNSSSGRRGGEGAHEQALAERRRLVFESGPIAPGSEIGYGAF